MREKFWGDVFLFIIASSMILHYAIKEGYLWELLVIIIALAVVMLLVIFWVAILKPRHILKRQLELQEKINLLLGCRGLYCSLNTQHQHLNEG